MRLLAFVEGKHEGVRAAAHVAEPSDLSEALPTLIQRLIPFPVEVDVRRFNDRSLRHIRGGGRMGSQHTRKVLAAICAAETSGYDAAVILVDEDGDPARVAAMTAAQAEVSVTTLPRACGAAIRTFDAWMRADEQALSRSLDGHPVTRSRAPERLSDPKLEMQSIHIASSVGRSLASIYADIARLCDLNIL